MQKITNQHDFVTGEAPKLVYSTLIPLSSQLCLRIRKAMNEILSHIATVASVTVIKGNFIFKEHKEDGKLILLFASAL